MLTCSDVVAAKLLVQLEAVPFEVARAHLRAVAADEAATDDLVARLQAAGALPGTTAARARRLVALYELVRAEAVYLQHLEREGLAREQAHALLAEIEASPVRERLGAVLVAQGRLTAEDDARLRDKAARSLAVEDERVVGRYLRDDFEGVARPVVPGAGADVRPEHVRLSALFRSPRTQKLVASEVRRRLREAAFDPFADALGGLPAAAPWTGLLPELPPGEPPALADPARAAQAGTARLRTPRASSRIAPAGAQTTDPTAASHALATGEGPAAPAGSALAEPPPAGAGAQAAPPKGPVEDALAVRAEVGPYRVVECLGRGGAGAVYLAEDVEAGGLVAVKVQHAGAATPDDVARFRREAAHLRRVDHPHVVHLIDEGTTDDGLAYLVLPAFPGRSLRVALREGPWAPAQALALLDGLLDALAALHAVGLVHRDVKPENVFVVAGRALEIRLLDLGIARPADGPSPAGDDAFRTRAGVISGSPAYVAPETITDEPIDGRTDLYSVGVLLFEVLTGGLPLTAATPYELLREHLVGVPRTLAQARPELAWHPELEGLVARLLAKEPALRPAAAALRDELRRGLGARLLAPPPAAPEPTGGGLLNGFFRRLGAR